MQDFQLEKHQKMFGGIGIEVTTNAQKLSGMRPNIVNILILITAMSKTSL